MNENLDFLEEEESNETILKQLSEMAEQLEKLEFEYVTAQEKADQAKKLYDEFRCVTVPNAFRLSGVSSVETTNGTRVSIERKYYCSPNKNQDDQNTMCDWLEKVGGDDLIKRQAIVDAAQIDKLIAAAIPHTQKRDVNTNSLKAWLKRSVGEEGIAVFNIEDVPSCIHFVCMDEARIKT